MGALTVSTTAGTGVVSVSRAHPYSPDSFYSPALHFESADCSGPGYVIQEWDLSFTGLDVVVKADAPLSVFAAYPASAASITPGSTLSGQGTCGAVSGTTRRHSVPLRWPRSASMSPPSGSSRPRPLRWRWSPRSTVPSASSWPGRWPGTGLRCGVGADSFRSIGRIDCASLNRPERSALTTLNNAA